MSNGIIVPAPVDLQEVLGLKGTITPTLQYKTIRLPALAILWGARGPFEWITEDRCQVDGVALKFPNQAVRHIFLSGTRYLFPGNRLVITAYWKDSSSGL